MKKFFTLLVAAFAAVSTFAQSQFTMDTLDATLGSEDNELVFNLTGATAYSTAIFNVTLPEGYTFYYDEDEDDYVIIMNIAKPEFTTRLTGNTLRIVAKSGSSKLFKADEGFIKIQIVAAADAKPGIVTISKLQFAKPDGSQLELDDVTGIIRVNGKEPTGISAVAGIKANGAIFDLSGRKVAKFQKGINIVNGNKIVK